MSRSILELISILSRLSLALLVFLLSACQKTDPNPEKKDLIYLDLLDLSAKHAAAAAKEEANVKDLENQAERAELKSGMRKRLQPLIVEARARLHQQKQLSYYYGLRAESRIRFVRRQYIQKHLSGQEWDPAAQHQYYEDLKRLRSQPSNWTKRVPTSIERYQPNFKAPELQPKGGEKASSEH